MVQKYVQQFTVIQERRAGEFSTLMERLRQGVSGNDCNMEPMTMNIKEFVEWRSVFPSATCN